MLLLRRVITSCLAFLACCVAQKLPPSSVRCRASQGRRPAQQLPSACTCLAPAQLQRSVCIFGSRCATVSRRAPPRLSVVATWRRRWRRRSRTRRWRTPSRGRTRWRRTTPARMMPRMMPRTGCRVTGWGGGGADASLAFVPGLQHASGARAPLVGLALSVALARGFAFFLWLGWCCAGRRPVSPGVAPGMRPPCGCALIVPRCGLSSRVSRLQAPAMGRRPVCPAAAPAPRVFECVSW